MRTYKVPSKKKSYQAVRTEGGYLLLMTGLRFLMPAIFFGRNKQTGQLFLVLGDGKKFVLYAGSEERGLSHCKIESVELSGKMQVLWFRQDGDFCTITISNAKNPKHFFNCFKKVKGEMIELEVLDCEIRK